MKFIRKILFSHIIVVVLAILLQFVFLLNMLLFFKAYSPAFYGFSVLLSALVVLWIVYSDRNPAYKIAWIIPIMLMPIFGGIFYLAFGGNTLSRKEKNRMKKIGVTSKENLKPNEKIIEDIRKRSPIAANQATYIQNYAFFPPYENTFSEYYPIGEKKFESLIQELEKAEKFIFMEYFIIEEGKMWNTILDVLVRKAAQGVDVRVIYDDLGCMLTLPYRYSDKLESMGIKCCVFNPLVPVLSVKFNTRDHRKITVIDGHTAFTGGINIADEYINEIVKHGHWKDMGIMIKGEAVWNFTVMFLTLWDSLKKTDSNHESYKVSVDMPDEVRSKGYVQPFSDNPLDNEPVGQIVYLNMINKAQKYVYITTPYLIIDSEMITALSTAAKSGVDVRIITPHHADKKYVHETTRSFYPKLLQSGVRIFEYEPGFMHGKTFVSDDECAVVGTINMDYRSLFLHFECGLWMYGTDSVIDVRKDFNSTLNDCLEVSLDHFNNVSLGRRLFSLILRLFAPLM